MRKFLRTLVMLAVVAGVILYAAFEFSPWPSVWLIRRGFDAGALEASQALEKHLPAGVGERRNIAYGDAAQSETLDIYDPPSPPEKPKPLIVWVHGGAWISGRKEDVTNYLKVLAGHGYTVANVDYAIAPSAQYPTPVVQTGKALAFLAAHASELKIDTSRVVLGGDSAGAQIVAQEALVIRIPTYAADSGLMPGLAADELKGLVLFCGGYNPAELDFDGAFGGFLRTVFWSYFGRRNFEEDPRLAQFAIPAHLTAAMPPMFITAGNIDPLGPQSVALADAARAKGITVDTLFFPKDYSPPLGHEYQFNLDTEAGQQALARTLGFLERL